MSRPGIHVAVGGLPRHVPASALGLLLSSIALTPPAVAATKPGLEGAQDLFRRNRWEEARTHLRAQWATLPSKDQAAGRFLIGRSYVREAEFYRAARRLGVEVGLAYLQELASVRANKGVAWIPLFTALYDLEAGDSAEAERALGNTAALADLPREWQATARLRRGVALQALGREAEARRLLAGRGAEAAFWRLQVSGAVEVATTSTLAGASGRRDRLFAGAVLLRSGRPQEAAKLLSLDLDAPDAEARPDPKKLLRFHDPALALAWERVLWERAVLALQPLAAGGGGVERTLAVYYLGQSLFRLGSPEATRYLEEAEASSLVPELQPAAKLLRAASSWQGRPPAAAELSALWEATAPRPELVLEWDELGRPELAKSEPFAGRLDARLAGLLQGLSERPGGALVGRWALARLRRGDEAGPLLTVLSEQRDDSNKNKIDWNDPLLLLALAAANQRDQEYAQALETLFELAKSFPGLRWLQWNLQGVYAARQKAGGETRISQ